METILEEIVSGDIITLCASEGVAIHILSEYVKDRIMSSDVNVITTTTLNVADNKEISNFKRLAETTGTVVVNVLPEERYTKYVSDGPGSRDLSDMFLVALPSKDVDRVYNFINLKSLRP